MKKLIVLSLAGLLILALGATANAQKLEFRASGFIDSQVGVVYNVPEYYGFAGSYGGVNGNYSINPFADLAILGLSPYGTKYEAAYLGLPPPAGLNKMATNWESRAHLKFDAVMGPSLSGTIYFEIDSVRWGNAYGLRSSNDILNTPFSPGVAGREANNFGAWTTDRTAVEVKNIYFDVGLPYFGVPWPITVRIGAQPIGVRPAMFLYSDGTGITAGIKADPVLINPIFAKAVASPDFTNSDTTIYGLQANAKISTVTVGGYALYYQMDTYPLFAPSYSLLTTYPYTSPQLFYSLPVVPGTQRANMWWLGAYAEGKAGPVDFNFDFVYDLGQEMSELSVVPHVNYQGFATRLNVEYPWEKFKFGVTGMYATGDDTRHTSSNGFAGDTTSIGTLSKHASGYMNPPASEQPPINSESVVVYGMEAGATGGYGIAEQNNYGWMNRGGFGGTWFAKLYAQQKITPWLKLTAQALYVGDTTIRGDTLGDPLKPNGQLRSDQTIGVELDIMTDIQLYKNLRLWLGYGYLFAGPALDINPGVLTPAGTRLFKNTTPDNPWAFRTRLIYTF